MRPFPSSNGMDIGKAEGEPAAATTGSIAAPLPCRRQPCRPSGTADRGTGADMVRQRHARVAIMLADKPALLPQAGFDEARIADDNALQTQQLVTINGTISGLADGAAPALNGGPAARALPRSRSWTSNLSGAGKPRCARSRSRGTAATTARGARARGRSIAANAFSASVRKHQRTEFGRAGQVIADAVARRILAVDGPLLIGVNHRHIGTDGEIGQVEAARRSATRRGTRGGGRNSRSASPAPELFNGGGAGAARNRRFRIARSRPSYFKAKVRWPSRSAEGA